MKLFIRIFARATLGLLLSAGSIASAQEEEGQTIPCKDVPAAVTSAFAQVYPAAKIKGCVKEVEDGKTAYEVSSTENGTGRDVLYYADGKLIVVEETIAIAGLPEPVRRAADKKFPNGKITLSEKLTRELIGDL